MSEQAWLDASGDLLAALAAAEDYGYSLRSSFLAAGAQLGGLDHDDLRAVASLALALMTTEMKARSGAATEDWSESFRFRLAMAEVSE